MKTFIAVLFILAISYALASESASLHRHKQKAKKTKVKTVNNNNFKPHEEPKQQALQADSDDDSQEEMAEKNQAEQIVEKQAKAKSSLSSSQTTTTSTTSTTTGTTTAATTTTTTTTPTCPHTNEFYNTATSACEACNVRCAKCTGATEKDCTECTAPLAKGLHECYGAYSFELKTISCKRPSTRKDRFFRPYVTVEFQRQNAGVNTTRVYTSDRPQVAPNAESIAGNTETFTFNWIVAETWDSSAAFNSVQHAFNEVNVYLSDYVNTAYTGDRDIGNGKIGVASELLFSKYDIGAHTISVDLKDSTNAVVGTAVFEMKLFR